SAEWVRGLSALGWGGSIGSLWFTAVIVELVMVCRSVSRPASGRFAVNQWTQLTLTRRAWRKRDAFAASNPLLMEFRDLEQSVAVYPLPRHSRYQATPLDAG